jgi:hypothetical protein
MRQVTGNQQGATTRVEIEHRGWDRLGSIGRQQRDANREGWATLLPHYVVICARSREP